ncbi:ribonuclease H-like domain-containing protein [Flagelloscypha sp. PMI_526]|nr:ribonuclease H-like domain-containing protein [Flagelloscypha sp. PMI_526]
MHNRDLQVLCSPEFRFHGHKWNPWDMYRCPDVEFAAKACVKRLGLRPTVPCTLGSNMYSIIPSEDRVSSCGMEVMVQTWPSYIPNIVAEELPPLRDQNWSLKADYEVIQIANYVDIRTATKNELTPSPKPPLRTIFTLDTCDPIPKHREYALIESWIDWFNDIDPDHAPKTVGIDGPYLSRIQDFKSPDTFIGGRNWDDHTSRIPGRIQLDFFNYIKILISESGEPTQNISLNAASQRFLKQESKEDIAYKEMRGLQLGSAADRKKLGVYCLKDAYLPLLLLDKLNALYKSLTSGTLPWTAFGASLDTKAKLEPRYLVPYIDRKQYREQQQHQKVMEEPMSGSGSARPI